MLSAICFSGCSRDDGLERVIISGTVSYQDKPLDNGTIEFLPDATSAAPISGAEIKQGNYLVDRNGGVAVGAYKIVIEGYHTDAVRDAQGRLPAMRGRGTQYLPAKYNEKSELKIAIPTGSSAITKDFKLTN